MCVMCICKRVLSLAYLLYKPDKGLFIIYDRGGGYFEGGIFWQVTDGGPHIFGKLPIINNSIRNSLNQ